MFVCALWCYAPDMSYVLTLRHVGLRLLGAMFGSAALFFAYYCARLAWIFSTHKTGGHGGGMYIGAVAFPAAVLVFGYIARALWRSAVTRSRASETR